MHKLIIHWALLLTLYNVILLSLATLPTVTTNPHPRSPLAIIFYSSAYVGQLFLFSIFLSVLSYLLALLIGQSAVFVPIISLLTSLMLLFFIANSVTYSKYRFNINITILSLVFQKGAGEVVQPSKQEYLLFVGGFVFFFIITILIQWLALWQVDHHFTPHIIFALLALLLFVYLFNQLFYSICRMRGAMHIIQYTVKIFAYHWVSLYHLIRVLGFPVINKNNRRIYQLEHNLNHLASLRYPLQPLQTTPQKKPLNILMVVIDAWRFDMLNHKVVPNLHQFSKQCENFTRHWSSGNTTQPGLFGLFYSLPPNYWSSAKKFKHYPALIQALLQQHYQFAIYSSATLINPPFDKTIFAEVPNLRISTPGKDPLDRDRQITKDFIQFTKQRDPQKPFFSYLHYDAAHGYYAIRNLPEHFSPVDKTNHITLKNTTDPEPLFNLYKNALYAIDQSIADLLKTLEEQDLLDSTVVMFTGDHGQEFNDHQKNYWEHPSNFGAFQVRTPLVVHWPGHSPAHYDYATCHYDIAPTLMQSVLQVNNPTADYSIGSNLFAHKTMPFIFVANYTNYGLINHEHIINLQRDGLYQITDLILNPLENAKLKTSHIEAAIELMGRYYA